MGRPGGAGPEPQAGQVILMGWLTLLEPTWGRAKRGLSLTCFISTFMWWVLPLQ